MWLTKFYSCIMNIMKEHEQLITESFWIGKEQQVEVVLFALQTRSQVHVPHRGVLWESQT